MDVDKAMKTLIQMEIFKHPPVHALKAAGRGGLASRGGSRVGD